MPGAALRQSILSGKLAISLQKFALRVDVNEPNEKRNAVIIEYGVLAQKVDIKVKYKVNNKKD